MDSLLVGLILGAVQGLTEFLPISSTGHLIITGDLLHFTGAKATTFSIVIQLGSILAVVWLYKERFINLVFPPQAQSISEYRKPAFSRLYGLWLLFLTTLPPGLLGLAIHDIIAAKLFNPLTVALAMGTGGLCMLAVEYTKTLPHAKEHYRSLDELSPGAALGIGLFQCVSLWPGFSRSASTIMGGMLLGVPRKVAAEYSFLAAVPIMCAATGYEVLKNWRLFSLDDLPFFATGFVCAFVFALLAIRTFISLLGRITLKPFAWYRILLAPVVYYVWAA